MRFVAPRERAASEALALSPRLLEAASRENTPWLAASVVREDFVALGAHQRAGRVLDLARCDDAGLAVFRRATSGTAFYAHGCALIFALALPRVDALAPDATPRTLLNRNVRGFLHGLTRCGTPAHYFGREWVSLKHRPCALLGYEARRDGGVLIELLAGFDHAAVLPEALRADEERAVDRGHGKAGISLAEALGPARDALAVAQRVSEGCAARWSQSLESAELSSEPDRAVRVREAREPVAEAMRVLPPRRCPIGWIDAARGPTGAWVGGDVLVAGYALERIAAGEDPGDFALDGATGADLLAALAE